MIEILVACAVMAMILVLMLSMVGQASKLWTSSNARIENFQGARNGFENLTRLLAQATLNTYWDYDNPNDPRRYIRQSELHFVIDEVSSVLAGAQGFGQAIFFQSPANYDPAGSTSTNRVDTGLTGRLNACGFYVEFASDKVKGWVPSHVNAPEQKRFRLMQWIQGTKSLDIYQTHAGADARKWINAGAILSQAMPVADNVIALLIWPKEPEAQAKHYLPDSYQYDSRDGATNDPQPPSGNQLPPLLQVAMVAIDERSAVHLGDNQESAISTCLAGLFQDKPGAAFDNDLKVLGDRLTAQKINYHVFVSAIPMREAKWSPTR